jgi:aryl carrier-like protein
MRPDLEILVSPHERKIEAALIDWFRRNGWEIDGAAHYADATEADYHHPIDLIGLARHIADDRPMKPINPEVVEAALIDWFRRNGWKIDVAAHYADANLADYHPIDLIGLARHIADEINR